LLVLLNFPYRGNKGRSGENFNDTVKLNDLKNPTSDARYSYDRFCLMSDRLSHAGIMPK